MTTITAKTILCSRNAAAPEKVLSTLLLRYPRFIHSELMTHRAFSRNAASSRAIPFEKQVDAMLADPAVPLWWGSNQPGMQAGDEVGDPEHCQAVWLASMELAITKATQLHEAGCHKQIVNRIIEPFTHITVLVSATEWGNFLELRDHPDAEPHIRILAQHVRRELLGGSVQILAPGEWHLPFVGEGEQSELHLDNCIALSVGRCASTSYKTVEGFNMTLERAERLHDQFVNSRPQHASPLEHVAQADGTGGGMNIGLWEYPLQHGNFVGFRQYRHIVT